MQHARDLCNKILAIRTRRCTIVMTHPIDDELDWSIDRNRLPIEVD
jgi:hypothetical protein